MAADTESTSLEAERRGSPYLEVLADAWAGGVVDLGSRDQLVVGRHEASDVCLGWDHEVSRTHALLERVTDIWTVVDDRLSTNGTFVNGQRVQGRHRLEHGDRLRLGRTLLVFHDRNRQVSETLRSPDTGPVDLTPAQRRVLLALCRPYAAAGTIASPASNRDIAEELSVSVEAVRSHMKALFDRLGVGDLAQNRKRAELARRAFELGLVSRRDL